MSGQKTVSAAPGNARMQRASRTAGTAHLNIWLHAGFVAALVACAGFYFASYVSLVATWARSGMFQFAFLIFPICAVLIWSRRAWLVETSAAPRRRGLILVAALGAIWLVGRFADVNVADHFVMVAVVPALVYVFYGPQIARILAFPLGYMFFAVPFGDFMVHPLQNITAHMSVGFLHLTQVPVFMSGQIIVTPASAWHVAAACSGVKFFLATTAFGVLYSYLFFQSLPRRLIFIACAMVVPVIANGLRVFFTILIGEYFGLHYATGTDHLIFGWQFFGTVLVLLFLAGWPWHEPPTTVAQTGVGRAADRANPGMRAIGGVTLAAVLVLAAAPVWFNASRALTASAAVDRPTLPDALVDLRRVQSGAVVDPGIVFQHASAHATAFYGNSASPLRLDYLTYAGAPRAGQELITMGNERFDKQRWKSVSVRRLTPIKGAPEIDQTTLAARHGSATGWTQAAIYRVGAHWTTSTLMVKAWQTGYGLLALPSPTSLVLVSTRGDTRASAAQAARAAGAAALALESRPSP